MREHGTDTTMHHHNDHLAESAGWLEQVDVPEPDRPVVVEHPG
ncbi:MAG TPA: hypothetical protein VH120_01455 [Gemmataceae bacterium]|jgi:hypothetical protein|nr:hypothetical protein [Gemmataceae bacterium]